MIAPSFPLSSSPRLSVSSALPAKVYLRRKEVEAVVGGWRQLKALEVAGHLRPVHLPGYTRAHYVRAEVQSVVTTLLGR